ARWLALTSTCMLPFLSFPTLTSPAAAGTPGMEVIWYVFAQPTVATANTAPHINARRYNICLFMFSKLLWETSSTHESACFRPGTMLKRADIDVCSLAHMMA